VSLFVVVFAVYPFAADLFRAGDIPKRLIPGPSPLERYLNNDCLPGSPQIQNIIPITSSRPTFMRAVLGTIGAGSYDAACSTELASAPGGALARATERITSTNRGASREERLAHPIVLSCRDSGGRREKRLLSHSML